MIADSRKPNALHSEAYYPSLEEEHSQQSLREPESRPGVRGPVASLG